MKITTNQKLKYVCYTAMLHDGNTKPRFKLSRFHFQQRNFYAQTLIARTNTQGLTLMRCR